MKYECYGENMRFFITDEKGRRRYDPKMKALISESGDIWVWDLEACNRKPVNANLPN